MKGFLKLKRDVYWTAVGTAGLEHLKLNVSSSGVSADGLVLRDHYGMAVRLRYVLHLTRDWRPTKVLVESLTTANHLHLTASTDGRWKGVSGDDVARVRGCADIDIMATPFTNTPAIRRLALEPGESSTINALFIRIPNLEIESHSQRYTCLAANGAGSRYRYENLESGFQAELLLDADHLVSNYTGVWQRA